MKAADVKRENDKRLEALGVAVNAHLPTIEEPAELKPRSAQDVATRAWVLSHIIGVGYGRTGKEMLEWLTRAGIQASLTPRERDFLKQRKYTDHDRAWAAWFAEAVHGCAWALGLVELEWLGGCPDDLVKHSRPNVDPRPSISAATLRPFDELYVQADAHYRLHWAARQARLTGSDFPQPEIAIQMRRHSFDWIVGLPYEWDDIPLDT